MGDEQKLQAGFAYSRMVQDILSGIKSGELKTGQRIQSETVLRKQYGISISSVKRGLGELVEQGILRRQRGSGTFVASVGAMAPNRVVRRDTIGVIRMMDFWRYHPFFSELDKGVMAGLARHGWQITELCSDISAPRDGNEISYRQVSLDKLHSEIVQRPELAGVLCIHGDRKYLSVVDELKLPLVCTNHGERGSVSYDWDSERERLFRIALREGARDLLVVGAESEKELQTACQRATGALGISRSNVRMRILPCTKSRRGLILSKQAHDLVIQAFSESASYDAILITGDFEAVGAVEALTQLPRSLWQDCLVVASLNKETRLPAQIPMIALMIDGYACGIALAEMMHNLVTVSDNYAFSQVISCTEVSWCEKESDKS